MAHPFPLASVFTYGMRRDADRTMLPEGSVWNLVDFVPDEIGAAAEGRGGWKFSGPIMTSATGATSLGYHPDLGKVYSTDGVGLWDAVAGGSSLGTFKSPMIVGYHRGYLFGNSWLSGGVPQAPYALKDDGTILQLSGAPKAVYGGAYKDHALFARVKIPGSPTSSSQQLNRIWFSAAGDPTTWDTTFGWWDTTGAITGIASTLNAILIFHGDSVERLRGTTPPPGSDMVLEPLFNDGCLDSRSISYWQQRVIWTSSRGIYLTDGVSTVDLTAAAGIKTYWISLLASYNGWVIAGGIYRDHYIVSIWDGSALVDCICINLNSRSAWRFSNISGSSFVNVTSSTAEKLYAGINGTARVMELSSLWSPGSSVKQDGDGTNPTPIIETGSYRGYDRLHRRWIQSMGFQKWRYAYLDYDLRDAASDNPTITLSYATTPAGGYTTATGGPIPETTDYSRVRRALNPTIGGATRADMLELKLAVNGPYAHARIYTLEGDFEPIDIGRLG